LVDAVFLAVRGGTLLDDADAVGLHHRYSVLPLELGDLNTTLDPRPQIVKQTVVDIVEFRSKRFQGVRFDHGE
jgi:hypothetical protein